MMYAYICAVRLITGTDFTDGAHLQNLSAQVSREALSASLALLRRLRAPTPKMPCLQAVQEGLYLIANSLCSNKTLKSAFVRRLLKRSQRVISISREFEHLEIIYS